MVRLLEDSHYARDTFSSQKAISSDMYFGRDAYDPQHLSEQRTRLREFDGASSISSAQYFGRDEEANNDQPGKSLSIWIPSSRRLTI
ncbi:hypothetical protein K493DRAFT_249838 [Basidiobolus meristosporus CBS 931.73]|uniref:Uncharacterized protein n=1 Tax=Basidiobolus meristosporus CBS 931.73 TaxID=1314790 RepID=A0A1Y1VQW0_9FUNG|nr:hypothetical protein K493DRAFT_249838 [Basidiobolus meristosporus CBS 931.73]|eukprot:ORX63668.1 hypothetical protein K493DRAFT_249838 [Basidiobolus meristosporus CBS 931.73]